MALEIRQTCVNLSSPFVDHVTLGKFLNLYESLLICKMGMIILFLMVVMKFIVDIHINYCYQTKYKNILWKVKKSLWKRHSSVIPAFLSVS